MLLGITGGIGSGKSAVTALLSELGAVTLSADTAARAVLAPGAPTVKEIAGAFGPDILLPDGRIDRAALGRVVFADPRARTRLEEITHPPILSLLRKQIDSARAAAAPGTVIAVEVPLLYEAGMDGWFDRVLVVTAPEDQLTARLRLRDGLTVKEVRQRMAAQIPPDQKAARADYVIDNSGTPEQLRQSVHALWRKLTAAEPPGPREAATDPG